MGLSCQIPLLLLVIDFGNTYSHKLLYVLLLPLIKHIFNIENVRWLIMADIFRVCTFPVLVIECQLTTE